MSDFLLTESLRIAFSASEETPLILETFGFSLVHTRTNEWKTQGQVDAHIVHIESCSHFCKCCHIRL